MTANSKPKAVQKKLIMV